MFLKPPELLSTEGSPESFLELHPHKLDGVVGLWITTETEAQSNRGPKPVPGTFDAFKMYPKPVARIGLRPVKGN